MADILEMQRLAAQARSLYDDPAFRRIYEKLYLGALDSIRFSLPEDQSRREEAYWRLRTLEELDRELTGELQAPKIEAKRQDRQR